MIQSRAVVVTSFFGTQTYSIDSKGRISVPASMRRAEGRRAPITEFVVVAGFEGCLVLYGPTMWAKVEKRLRRIPLGDLRGRGFLRAFLKDAAKVTVDAQGRITLPPALIARAGLGKEAVLHGQLNGIEVWSPERYQVSVEQGEQDRSYGAEHYLGQSIEEDEP